MNNIYIVTAQQIRDNTPIQSNVDDKYINDAIQNAQEIEIRNILGDALFEQVLAEKDSGNISTNIQNLINEIERPLIYWTLYYSLDNQFVKMTEIGLQQKNTEKSTPPDLETFNKYKDSTRSIAQNLTNNIRKYLLKNSGIYNLFAQESFDESADLSTPYFSGIQFKKRNIYCDCNYPMNNEMRII